MPLEGDEIIFDDEH